MALPALVAYGWFEAGWLREQVVEVLVPGLPEQLEGLTIGHLSDLHLGAPGSKAARVGRRAARWVATRDPDLVCITGDLVARPRGLEELQDILGHLRSPFVVLGNHDVGETKDPFSQATHLRATGATILVDEAVTCTVHGCRINVAGADPRSRAEALARLSDPTAAFNVLLVHRPDAAEGLPPHRFDLVLAGHLHAGQVTVSLGRRRLGLAHPWAVHLEGLRATPAGWLHVSAGTGTTFVPFRLNARPAVTELVMRKPAVAGGAEITP